MPFTISPAQLSDVSEMARVNVEARVDTYRGMLSEKALTFVTVEKKARRLEKHIASADPSCVYLVAKDEMGAVVGLATGGPWEETTIPSGISQPLGEIFALYLSKEAKGQGLGLLLLREVARSLSEKGMPSVGLSVLEENLPARGFYQKMGGVEACPHTVLLADEPYRGIIYVWPDIKVLA